MMPTALDLCTRLGYPDAGAHESGSMAKILLDDLEAFVINEPVKSDPDSLTTLYLLSPVKKFRYPYSWTPDGHEITELLSKLFSMIVQNRAMREQATEHEVPSLAVDQATTPLASTADSSEPCTQVSERSAPQLGVEDLQSQNPGDTTTEVPIIHVANDDASIATIKPHNAQASMGLQDVIQGFVTHGTSRDAGSITKLALREPTLVANLLKAGLSEPFPATASSEAELVHMLNDLMAQHPDRNPPWSKSLNRQLPVREYGYSVAVFLASTSEELYTSVRQIGPFRTIYILADSDGSCILGRPVIGNSKYKRGYYGWLGGDLGFTSKPFASSDWLPSRNSASETLSSRNDQANVVPSQGAQRDPTNDVEINTALNLPEVRQATPRRNQAERQIQGPRWRSQTPPLSSLGIIMKSRWPPQYLSPPPTYQPEKRKASDAKYYKRRNISGLLPNRDRSRTSSPEFVSESPVNPSQGLRRSARGNQYGNYRIPSASKTPKKTRTTAEKSANITQPAVTTLQPSIQESPPIKDVNVHFFLSNDSLGAVPVTINECNTASSFFSQALSAWNLLGGGDHAGNMAAVSVTFDGFDWPIVLPWGNPTAFERMIETMAIAKTGKMGNLEVRVKCIKA